MSNEILDLAEHDIDEAVGKILTLNGVRYVLHELADEGGETFIFPLENQVSGLFMFLAKIFKFKSDSPEFDERKRVAFSGFVLSMVGVPTAHEEQYEIPGGLMKFQRQQEGAFLGTHYFRGATPMPVTQKSCHELIERASSQEANSQWLEAIDTVEEILDINSNHSLALFMLAELYMKNGQPERVSKVVAKAISIEKNDTRLYHVAARSHMELGDPHQALAILDQALLRYSWEWKSWELKREIATRFALVDVIREMEEDAQKRLDADGHSGANDKMRMTVADDFRLRLQQTSSFYDEVDKAKDLTKALELFMEILSCDDNSRLEKQFTNGQDALRLARKWLDSWLGRVIAFLTNSFFLFESTAAAEVYGDIDNLMKTMESDSVESHYLKGFSAILRGDRENILPCFRAAASIKSADPYVQFGLVLALRIEGDSSEEAAQVMSELRSAYHRHPVVNLASRYV